MTDVKNDLEAALREGGAALVSRQLDKAARIATDLTSKFPSEARGWHLLGAAELAQSNPTDARRHLEHAISLNSGLIEVHLDHARSFIAVGDRGGATRALRKAATIGTNNATILNAIGALYSQCEEQRLAADFFKKAIDQNPHAEFFYNLASAQRMLGDLEEAYESVSNAISRNPRACRAHFLRSNLRRSTKERNHIEEIKKIIDAGGVNWRGKALLHYSVAKEYEDLGNYKNSFVHINEGAKLKRQNTRYSVESDIEVIDRIIAKVDGEIFGGGDKSPEPIFVLGLPRSGTTLVERIISSHSDVISQGELSAFGMELQKAVMGEANKKLTREDLVDRSVDVDFGKLGKAYLERARPVSGTEKKFVDKMPLNYLYCGLIHAALPNAKLVLLRRHPIDSCYAMYKMTFEGVYPFSYDLEDLGKYYLAFDRLMAHWQKVLGDRILEIRYEDLVENQEDQTRRLIDFCGLDWEDACLEFHNNSAPSSTASAVQVRQKLYSSSVGLWKNIQNELQPLSDILTKGGVEL